MRILAVIPARGGSKGVPGKNIKLLGGKPLVAYSIEKANQSKLLDLVILSTETKKIAAIGKKFGANVPFLRPLELAQDDTPTIDVLKHAIDFYESQTIFFDAICILQPTTPFRECGFIDKAIAKFIETAVDTLISVLPVPHHFNPHWVFELNGQNFLKIATGDDKIIPRRQELPQSFYRDGSIYLIKTEIIKNQNSLFGATIGHIQSSEESYVNIDMMQDWENAEKLLANKLNNIGDI
ncbi:acylneuraminate cytidylyltransferase family protein [Subsaximicrobium wynnwilliamsii]|uniref:Acylneuraminate cytidylyltransferase family protein n=1 Tax=Subsaximicrobium wynnwilliamsii TaxID=291179 RepID=A0A5C6ZFH4_9FLAO|nr:acylneuraminate cytidylyltransferase family protein [Subsaximicrobium wynnwilliamsii]TXD81690.1 acylneuraminate cytidylyltransferase family protein [Subsaximicrobium wynnwilliamsii]TXD87445.1 acylneuraminate cytidylyltransferase family protein [Subsaximicrobium wynnwilliamsii]TXE01133.1 acylneuraminate cytidylyltransferase family protein [Subsaximicrobium wynnwilliamsii]